MKCDLCKTDMFPDQNVRRRIWLRDPGRWHILRICQGCEYSHRWEGIHKWPPKAKADKIIEV